MSSLCDRKTINEAIPDLRSTGNFFKYIGSYNFLNVTTMATLYSVRSGDKKVSSFLDYFLENSETITDADARTIGEILKNVYEHKWNQIAGALRKEYDILTNYKINENIERNNETTQEKNNTYGQQETTQDFGEVVNTFQQGDITVTNLNGQKETQVLNKTNGFNSGLVDDTSSSTTNNSYTDTTTTSSLDDVDTTQQHTNTTTQASHEDVENISNNFNETVTNSKSGQNGNSQDMILKEFEVRKYDFITMMFKDIDSYLTLKVYC